MCRFPADSDKLSQTSHSRDKTMESFKQIMATVDSYMSSLIESSAFPHPEGQFKFSARFCWNAKSLLSRPNGESITFLWTSSVDMRERDVPFIVSHNQHDNDSSLAAVIEFEIAIWKLEANPCRKWNRSVFFAIAWMNVIEIELKLFDRCLDDLVWSDGGIEAMELWAILRSSRGGWIREVVCWEDEKKFESLWGWFMLRDILCWR
jgi:hypothetical protein